ncbi:SagB/ThcOx family dehydrogenase [Gordonia sp. TBRC 11910]|uniref:SagB/ThcOx family dehydrogenase n=1 Tax=Gordonia asplenii TaxID=2725283 RepID=A0A848L996_9ACTN|nr:SagB family peptide dehydrogenase [Gordonia asplenii]NMO04158.1 SagB/ThcOx family dehydrogenase [Gordonia asplenii]
MKLSVAGIVSTYSFADDVKCLLTRSGAVILPYRERLDALSADQVALLRQLNGGSATVGDDAPPSTLELISRLSSLGAVRTTVAAGDRKLYSLNPFRAPSTERPTQAPPSVAPSRFTVVRRCGAAVVAENPMSWCDITFHDSAALSALFGLDDAALDADVVARLRADALWAGHLSEPAVEDAEFRTRSWSPHELWFHRRSTVGNRLRGNAFAHFGPTRWADGRGFEPLPARRDAFPGATVELPRPDLDALRERDITLTAAIEDRRSVRSFDDDNPVSLDQLAELLYRSSRTRSVTTIGPQRAVPEELPSRPYPSGGSLYETEIYLVVRLAAGLDSGLYHYDSLDHVLRRVADYDHPAVADLIAPSAVTLADGRQPQVLLIPAARVGRIMWTYEQMPYAVIMKHVGVLTQTLYLIATSMGLGGVAQGYVDTQAFAAATGNDELVECGVGSFVVGSVRA